MSKKQSLTMRSLHYYWLATRNHLGLFVALVASTIGFCGFLTYGNPYVMSLIVDRISADPVAPEAVFDVFGPYIAALIGINLAGQTCSKLQDYTLWKLQIAVNYDLATMAFDCLCNQSLSFHSNRFGGTLVSQTSKFMAGYTQLNPRTGALSQLIQFRGAIHPEELQTEPTVFSLISDAGNRATSVGLTRFMASPLTRAALCGSDYIGHDDANKRVRIAADTAKEPGLTYLYMREIDKAGHAYGWHSDEWQVALERVDMRLGQLHRQVPKGTLIVVIADHGMATADQGDEARIDMALDPVLQQGVRLVGGEPRATMLYAQDGVDAESIAERWRARLGDRAWIRTKQQVIDCGLLGPMRPDVPEMLGDVFVYAARENTIVDTRSQTEGATRMPGVHGSQTMMEMDVPCLIDLVD